MEVLLFTRWFFWLRGLIMSGNEDHFSKKYRMDLLLCQLGSNCLNGQNMSGNMDYQINLHYVCVLESLDSLNKMLQHVTFFSLKCFHAHKIVMS